MSSSRKVRKRELPIQAVPVRELPIREVNGLGFRQATSGPFRGLVPCRPDSLAIYRAEERRSFHYRVPKK